MAKFTELAKEHSTCPSGKSGGSLGEFGPGQVLMSSRQHCAHDALICVKGGPLTRGAATQMVKEFNDVVFTTGKVGKVEGPVKTQFGYHLILITKRGDESM